MCTISHEGPFIIEGPILCISLCVCFFFIRSSYLIIGAYCLAFGLKHKKSDGASEREKSEKSERYKKQTHTQQAEEARRKASASVDPVQRAQVACTVFVRLCSFFSFGCEVFF